MASTSDCSHPFSYVRVPLSVEGARFQRPNYQKRKAAATRSGRVIKQDSQCVEGAEAAEEEQEERTFPAPLVLPGDDLAIDPQYPPQSFKSFLMSKNRNAVSQTRKVLYVASVPEVTSEMTVMKSWTQPAMTMAPEYHAPGLQEGNSIDYLGDICNYLAAFFHGLEVRPYARKFRWVPWDSAAKICEYIGLATSEESCVRVRCRPSPDSVAPYQLNLNDILDSLPEVVPQDAQSIVLLVDHDMYEDEDDDFCCGRAYGGSRVAVVSSFRYNPCLDEHYDIAYSHMWPASHCSVHINRLINAGQRRHKNEQNRMSDSMLLSNVSNTALGVAIRAAAPVLCPKTPEDFAGLWFSRVARTVSHELGHCLGLDHCVYYACVMQGTAGLGEDARQPPYLCPICLLKVAYAIAGETADRTNEKGVMNAYVKTRHEAVAGFCREWDKVGMFAAFGAWVNSQLLGQHADAS